MRMMKTSMRMKTKMKTTKKDNGTSREITASPVILQLLEASKKAMHCLTCEQEKEWRDSQSYDEAPYHFLWKAITEVENGA